jgi:hypothetical protein
MTLNIQLAEQVHDWLIVEGRKCDADGDLDVASARFLERWPRVHPKVLLYVSEMLVGELHVRTFWPSKILDRGRNRTINESGLRRRWWRIAGSGSSARSITRNDTSIH